MKYIADLHIHSPFSRATSKTSDLHGLFAWSRVKGIQVVGTGDFTHPGWLQQLKELLVPAEPGFHRLKNENIPPALPGTMPEAVDTRFILTAEISSIYKRHGHVRKVHNILYVPDFASVERLNRKFAGIGNIESDGRPILGLDSRDLLEILLSEAPEGFLVPAHIWTPWFSLFGSKSGFNSVEECYGDLSAHIFAMETGLSSDPEMNRRISALDRFALISNSDCHSPGKLGREANILNTEFSYFGLREALKAPNSGGFSATVEFYPEEGKYHCDGHRKCQVCLEPAETRKLKELCPVCGRPLTVGVLHRVMELADRDEPCFPAGAPKVHSLIPLAEVLGEILDAGPNTKGVMAQYANAIARFGSEFNLLLNAPLEEIRQHSPVLGEAVARIRGGQVIRQPGYDGEFGIIKVFTDGERAQLAGQISLFAGRQRGRRKDSDKENPRLLAERRPLPASPAQEAREINAEQKAALASTTEKILVAAGPGTGKTFTLVARIEHLLNTAEARAEEMVAITFTNRAARELRERLGRDVGPAAEAIFVGTFHRFCLEWLRGEDSDLAVLEDAARDLYIRKTFPELARAEQHLLAKEIAGHLDRLNREPASDSASLSPPLRRYLASLNENSLIELDQVVPALVARLKKDADFFARVSETVRYLFVDEFQDLNLPQYELVLLLGKKAGVFAIGDPNQAIYGFRGSNLLFFQKFKEIPGVTTLALIRNYRSAPAIIDGAASLIRHNRSSGDTQLLAQSRLETRIEWHTASSAAAEAEFIVRRIEESMGGISSFSLNSGRGGDHTNARSFADFAVLFRLSQVADAIGDALHKRGIPFQLVGATPYYMQAGLKPAYNFLQASSEEATLPEYLALLKGLPGLGEATLALLEKSLPLRSPDFSSAAARIPLASGAAAAIEKIGRMIREFRENAGKAPALSLSHAMREINIDPETPEAKRLLALAGAFGGNLASLREHLRQSAQATVYDARAEAVSLMTMHAAKGLEFPVVFLAGLEEEIIPCTIANLKCDIEEERRLFYVAMTRAKENLILTNAASRIIFNRIAGQRASRFIQEIPVSLLKKIAPPAAGKKKPSGNGQLKLF
ncbi:UvrD-helicase domain-containing protein [Thiovibrio sp. JS02]